MEQPLNPEMVPIRIDSSEDPMIKDLSHMDDIVKLPLRSHDRSLGVIEVNIEAIGKASLEITDELLKELKIEINPPSRYFDVNVSVTDLVRGIYSKTKHKPLNATVLQYILNNGKYPKEWENRDVYFLGTTYGNSNYLAPSLVSGISVLGPGNMDPNRAYFFKKERIELGLRPLIAILPE